MNFTIPSYRNHESCPSIRKPEILGCFCLNGQDRMYSEDLSQLKYYNESKKKKKVQYDLNEGINSVLKKPKDIDERIDHMCKWIINNHTKILADPDQKRWLKPEIICYRGLLTKICCTPFENRDGWIICAAKFHGNIYLCAFDTEEQIAKNNNMTDRHRRFMSWGFKFEQFILSDSPDKTPNTKEPVNESEEFNCVLTTKLGNHSLLYGAEMDGIVSKEIIKEPVNWKSLKFVELKTCKIIKGRWDLQTFRKRLLKWWCQSFLVGIEEVVYGTRTDDGIVVEVDSIAVSEMPRKAQDYWNASASLHFCNMFLDHVKDVVTNDCNKCIYKFEYTLNGTINMKVLPGSSKLSFLRDWYKQEAEKIIKINAQG